MATNTLPNGYLLDDRYEIVSVLGQGGFGITYLAKSIKLEHQVVIKEFLPQNMAVRDQSHYTVTPYSQGDSLYSHLLKRFVEEARLLANLRHPNIVKVVDFLEANETAYFIMDYEEGETLEDYLERNQTLNEQDILSIMMPILEGTKYVHSKGVLHRDIAPDNIYLKTNGMPMLIDFGAARNAIAQQSQVLSAIAKDGYSPPEQYTPNTEQNASTDIYALGAVMYRMITGNKPANAAQRQMALLKGDTDPIGNIVQSHKDKYSKTLLQAIVQALDIQQEKRLQSIEEFQKAIAEGVQQQSSTNTQNTPPAQEKSSKTGLIIGVIVALLVVGGAIGYLILQPKSDITPMTMDTTDISGNKAKKMQEETDRVAEEIKKRNEQIQIQKDELDRLNREMEAQKTQAQIEKNRRELAKAEQERLEQDKIEADRKQNLGLVDSYTAKIGYYDHYNSRGTPLEKYSEILRQDRANYHKFNKRDSEDEGDQYFTSKGNRAILEDMLYNSNISYSVRNAIENNNPLIEVRIYKDRHLEIDLK